MRFYRQELLDDAIQNNRPFPTWDGATVVAWLEVCLSLFIKSISIFLYYSYGLKCLHGM